MNTSVNHTVEKILKAVGHGTIDIASVCRHRVIKFISVVSVLTQEQASREKDPERQSGIERDTQSVEFQADNVVNKRNTRNVLVKLQQT